MKLTISKKTVELAAQHIAAMKTCDQRPNNPLEAIGYRAILAQSKGEEEVNIDQITLALITGDGQYLVDEEEG